MIYVYVYIGACGGQKGMSDVLELELWMVRGLLMWVPESKLRSSVRAASSYILSHHLSRPRLLLRTMLPWFSGMPLLRDF